MGEIKKFQDLVNQITTNELVLPDFQRKFVWKEGKMVNLYASVLCRIPIGSILTLESDDAGFACKKIGAKLRKGEAKIESDGKLIMYLIDGQQRITSLFAGFTTYFFEAYKNDIKNLASKNLENMFFLIVPSKTVSDRETQDLFNIKSLNFPDDILKEKRYFSTNEMREIISSEKTSVILGKKNCVIDISNTEHINLIEKYCVEEHNGVFHIPLQYINNDNSEVQLSFDNILTSVASRHNIAQDKEKNDKARKLWVMNIKQYLSECLLTLKLNQIVVENSDKSRAIDIYSNLNQGGAPLSVFDLVTAKVGGVREINYNYYDKVVEYFSSKFDIDSYKSLVPEKAKTFLDNYTHIYDVVAKASIIEKNEISPQFIEVFLKVLTFLITKENNNSQFRPETLTKRDKILELDALKISEKTECVCTAMKKALFFFQTRCGIRKFSEINYKAQFGLVAFIFTEEKFWNNKNVHDFLEYWYWISLFGYKYPTKQDISIYEEINGIWNFFEKKDFSKFSELKNYREINVFKIANITDKNTLTMKNTDTGTVPPNKISDFICQFYISQGYKDFHTDENINFLCENNLQIHHIFPLGSDKKIGQTTKEIRNDESDIHNSPLNKIAITDTSNSDISDMDFQKYSKDEKVRKALASIHYNSVLDGETIEKFLEARFESVQNEVNIRLDELEKSVEKNMVCL